MSKVHILAQQSDGQYAVIIHAPVPAGSNSAGFSWVSVLLAGEGGGVSALNIGTGVGEITQTEADEMLTGDILEFSATIRAESGGATVASIDAMVDAVIVDKTNSLASKYKWFGHAQ